MTFSGSRSSCISANSYWFFVACQRKCFNELNISSSSFNSMLLLNSYMIGDIMLIVIALSLFLATYLSNSAKYCTTTISKISPIKTPISEFLSSENSIMSRQSSNARLKSFFQKSFLSELPPPLSYLL